MSRRLSTLLALLAAGASCAVVYTDEEPIWYLDCVGTNEDCACGHPSQAGLKKKPGVKVCSAATAAGICCSHDSGCLCRAVRCANNGALCQCAFWPEITGDLTDCGSPAPGQTCCMDAQRAVCTCEAQACSAGTSPVPSCSPQYFTCDLLAGSDASPVQGVALIPEPSCTNGAIDNFDPCDGVYACSE
jgi:hypothetical protein